MQISHARLALTEISFAAFGISGLTFVDLHLETWWEKGLAALALFGFCILFIVRKERRVFRFENDPENPKFVKFFAKWYSAEGRLDLYCDDLGWIVAKELKNALALKANDGKLHLHLKRIDAEAENLQRRGAVLCQVPLDNTFKHKFSILTNDNFRQIIIRNKAVDGDDPGGSFEFISTNSSRDPHLMALAEDVLAQCTQI